MKRFLIRGTNWLGDAVMSTPALMRLREKFPNAHIALLTPEKLEQIWSHHSAVDEVISFSPRQGVFATAGRLRAGKFDTALVLPNSPRSAMEVFFAGIPRRIGYARPWRNFFLTQTIAPRIGALKMRKRTVSEIKTLVGAIPQAGISGPLESGTPNRVHQSREYLHLAAALGANPDPLPAKLVIPLEEVEAARQKFGLTSGSNPIFGLNAGAEYGSAKRWPVERFIAAAREIRKRTNCSWVLFGGKNDAELASRIQSALGEGQLVFNFTGKTSLREMMSLLKDCRVFLTNDTGPMHVAAALNVPVMAIFGSTSPELTAPMAASGSRVQILASDAACSPCFLRECPIDFRCMNGIGVEAVVDAVLKCSRDT